MSLNKAPSSSLQKNAFMATFNCKLAAIRNMFISPPPQYHLKKKKTPKNGRQSHGVLHDVSSEPNDAFANGFIPFCSIAQKRNISF